MKRPTEIPKAYSEVMKAVNRIKAIPVYEMISRCYQIFSLVKFCNVISQFSGIPAAYISHLYKKRFIEFTFSVKMLYNISSLIHPFILISLLSMDY